jgi:PDZ domain-containing protein
MRNIISPGRLLIAGGVLAVITGLILWLAPSDDYLWLPDRARPVAPLVTVEGEKRGGGTDGIYFVDLIQRRATLLESIFPEIRDGSTLVPGNDVNPLGISEGCRQRLDLGQMARSQEIAAAVALRSLGYAAARVRATGALVTCVVDNSPAEARLSPGDVISQIDGSPVRTVPDLRRLIARHRPGEAIRLTVRRARGLHRLTLKTAADPEDRSRSIIGIFPAQAAQIDLPVKVRIDTGNIGGPSAGLAFALDVMEKLGRDVDHGHLVAATGELGLDGSVGPIGGIKQKTIGARTAGVDVFLVPVANAAEARANADGLRVIPVRSLAQALHALATLPEKR